MNASAIIMLIFGVLFLYGGIAYFISIALRSKGDAPYTRADNQSSGSGSDQTGQSQTE
jgi:hypothetical protein